jgi:hypothetical protein
MEEGEAITAAEEDLSREKIIVENREVMARSRQADILSNDLVPKGRRGMK